MPWGRFLIGFMCPKCGANMLTDKDYNDTERALRTIDWLNKWFGWIGYLCRDSKRKRVRVKLHDGKMDMKVLDEQC